MTMLTLSVAAQAVDFTTTMTKEERAATGIDRLSPEELAQLKAIIERYKSSEVAVVTSEAQKKVEVAEAKVRAAESRAIGSEPGRKKQPSWVSALLTLQNATEKPDAAEAFEDKLEGTLKSFDGRRRFKLQSGQVWEMIQSDYYSGPSMDSPTVSVKPGMLGVYWLQIKEAGLRVKVRLVRIEEK
jgi:hypothetical protein